MPDWRKARRLDAGGDGAKEKQLQFFFDRWDDPPAPVAGGPQWLWDLKKPSHPSISAFGYKTIPDAYWGDPEPRTVAELKYGNKHEPFVVAQVLHSAYLLRLQLGGEQIRSVVVSQQNHAIRAAVTQLPVSLMLHHIEADLLSLDTQTILWLSCPHARLREERLPTGCPLEATWTSLRWFGVEGECTWVAHDETSKPPFLHGPVAMISRFRTNGRYKWILWFGTLPAFGSVWSKAQLSASGGFWIWDEEAVNSRESALPTRFPTPQ